MTYREAVEYINLTPQYAELSGVERSRYLLEEMKHPEKNLKIIHIAGTNGKGSTCAYLESILREAGYKTGLFTSPHLVDIRERIKIDGQMVDQDSFAHGFQKVYEAQERMESNKHPQLAYFDFLFGIAMYIFKKQNVDFVIMETGLGGKLDSTNAVDKTVLSILTSISLDHTQVLGDTIDKIAGEKAGIIKEHTPVIYMDNNELSANVIKHISQQKDSECIAIHNKHWKIVKNNGKHIDFLVHNSYYKSDVFSINTGAPYQVMNCVAAITAASVLKERGIAFFDSTDIMLGVQHTRWDGRMEEIVPNIYIDGAHNLDGIDAFIEAAVAIKKDKQCTLLFSVVKDKNYEGMIESICTSGVFDRFILTGISGTRRLDTETIMKMFRKYTDNPVKVFDDSKEAYQYGVAINGDGIMMCAGSLYLVGEIKSFVLN